MKLKALALGVMMVTTGAANAAIISSSDSIANTTTNWSDLLTLSKFNSALGTLNSVKFNYGGTVASTFKVESLDNAPATVSANTNGSLVFGVPLSDTVVVNANASQALGAFDITIDFGGLSGFDFGSISGSNFATQTLLSGFGAFVGLGTYDISIDGLGLSSASGAGNLLAQINTSASANIEVIYDYTPTITQVSEPASLALLGLGLFGLGAARRRSSTKFGVSGLRA